jgi:uncharacterized membrane protein
MAILSSKHRGSTDVRVERDITVGRTAEDLFAFWRNLENLPLFMGSVDRVEILDDTRSLWTTTTSDGRPLSWEAEILEEQEPHSISWASVKGSDVETWGSVHFAPAPGDRGTEVRLVIRFIPPSSERVSEWFWNLFGEEPADQLRNDLRRFKQLMELGEIVRAR